MSQKLSEAKPAFCPKLSLGLPWQSVETEKQQDMAIPILRY